MLSCKRAISKGRSIALMRRSRLDNILHAQQMGNVVQLSECEKSTILTRRRGIGEGLLVQITESVGRMTRCVSAPIVAAYRSGMINIAQYLNTTPRLVLPVAGGPLVSFTQAATPSVCRLALMNGSTTLNALPPYKSATSRSKRLVTKYRPSEKS